MFLHDVAKLVDGQVVGDADREIFNVQKIEEAVAGEISFIANHRYERFVATTMATALLVGNDFEITRPEITYIRTADPYLAFLKLLRLFAPVGSRPPAGVHPSAVVADDVVLGEAVAIGPHVVLSSNCHVGSGTVIHANTVVGVGARIGEGCTIHSNVSIYHDVIIGSNVIIHAGTVIGADGFGFVPTERGTWEKIPQIGSVVIEDDVEIGANVTVDRATLGVTRICSGVKLDNLIHIAHNVVVGRNTVIAAQTGVSGSTRLGESNLIAGQVGLVGHIETADHVIIEAQSGVSKSIRNSGRYFGHPVKEHSQALRQEAALRQLPDLLQDFRDMKNRLEQLESAVSNAVGDTEGEAIE